MQDSIRLRLRAATAAQHERVDAAFSSYNLEDQAGYRAFLLAHLRVVQPVEVALEKSGIAALITDWPARQRRHALLADLEALGTAGPLTEPLAIRPTPGWCLGACYVLEGSRLGNRLLARRVAAANPGAPLHYLAHSDTTPSWPGFLEQFEQGAKQQPWDQLLAGARDCFDLFVTAAKLG
ncbi:biliverdin-producing heme oxygenase [Stutzerimonas marianensis]